MYLELDTAKHRAKETFAQICTNCTILNLKLLIHVLKN